MSAIYNFIKAAKHSIDWVRQSILDEATGAARLRRERERDEHFINDVRRSSYVIREIDKQAKLARKIEDGEVME